MDKVHLPRLLSLNLGRTCRPIRMMPDAHEPKILGSEKLQHLTLTRDFCAPNVQLPDSLQSLTSGRNPRLSLPLSLRRLCWGDVVISCEED